MEVRTIFDSIDKIYIHGRWGLETLSPNKAVLDSVYNQTLRHKVFIAEKIEREVSGTNSSYIPNFNGFIGLAKKKDPKSSYEPYGEYLKNRKLISENTLAIELKTESFSSLNFTFGVFNRSSISAPLLTKQGANGKINMYAASTGFKLEGSEYKFTGSGYINFDFTLTESIIET